MAITKGNITTNAGNFTSGGGGTSAFSHNNDGDYLLVGVMQGFADDALNPTAVTYGGTSMTKIGEVAHGSGHGITVWELINPPAGAANVVLTFTNQIVMVIVARSFSGVHQTTPKGTVVTNSGSSTTPSTTVSSASGELVADFVVARQLSAATATVGAGQTQDANLASNGSPGALDSRGLCSTEAGAGSVTMDWTLSASEPWKAVGVPIKPAGGGGGTATPVAVLLGQLNGGLSS